MNRESQSFVIPAQQVKNTQHSRERQAISSSMLEKQQNSRNAGVKGING